MSYRKTIPVSSFEKEPNEEGLPFQNTFFAGRDCKYFSPIFKKEKEIRVTFCLF